MLLSPRIDGLTSLFKEVRVFKELEYQPLTIGVGMSLDKQYM